MDRLALVNQFAVFVDLCVYSFTTSNLQRAKFFHFCQKCFVVLQNLVKVYGDETYTPKTEQFD